jgi:hypothetical protein
MNQNKSKCNAIKKLKLGVIGAGMIVLIHIKTLDRMKECDQGRNQGFNLEFLFFTYTSIFYDEERVLKIIQ